MIRTIQCTNGETCYADECMHAGMCMHQDEAPRGSGVTAFACPPKCEHDFSGPMHELEPKSGMYSKVCSKCGASAFDLALMGGI